MELSANFTLNELVKSQTAARRGIENTPSGDEIAALRAVTANVLQPVRDRFARPVRVSSGYRCAALCLAIGSTATSQHTKGQAADFEVPGVPNPEVAAYIRDNLDYDQLILEFHEPDKGPDSGWVHCSYIDADTNRRQTLTINRDGVFAGLRGA